MHDDAHHHHSEVFLRCFHHTYSFSCFLIGILFMFLMHCFAVYHTIQRFPYWLFERRKCSMYEAVDCSDDLSEIHVMVFTDRSNTDAVACNYVQLIFICQHRQESVAWTDQGRHTTASVKSSLQLQVAS